METNVIVALISLCFVQIIGGSPYPRSNLEPIETLKSDDCRRQIKMDVSTCIAECLNLTVQASQKEKCRYSFTSGAVMEKRTPNCLNECGDIELLQKSQSIKQAIAGDKALRSTLKRICGKYILLGAVIPLEAEYAYTACVHAKQFYNVWSPSDMKEVLCMLNNMPQNLKDVGRLRLYAIKNNCSRDFVLCDALNPKPLPKDFPPVVPSPSNIPLVAPYFGSCMSINFKYKNNNVSSLQLVEIPCNEKVPFFCEYTGDLSDTFSRDRLVN